jgi:2-hydroxychromene-2-carboxylate isomerase
VDDVNISDLGAVLDIAAGVGVDRDELSAVLAGTEIKARLAAEVDLGLARGVFGRPSSSSTAKPSGAPTGCRRSSAGSNPARSDREAP